MNVVCGPPDEGFPTVLMSAATGSKLAKLGWNKIEHQNTFFQYLFHFSHISGIHLTLKIPYVFQDLEIYMKTWFLYCFIKKWFHTILYHFKSSSHGLVVSHRLATRKVLGSPLGLCKGCYSPWLLTIPHWHGSGQGTEAPCSVPSRCWEATCGWG